ncbi:helix-turn-helix transcriptional regulator [Faecalibacillus faecis]|uniref:helix-turn-helix transcriptional regulator n=1 Tax=Faecalibacillus faecis TaxID=1982628 RepID=UPI003868A2E3
MSIGNKIYILRKKYKMSQEQFASLFFVTRQTVSNWENEKNFPDLQILIKISNQFNI